MTPKQILESILNVEYKSEDDDLFKINLLDGMSDKEIEDYKKQLPNNYLPTEIEELLKFCRGFNFYGLDDICFDSYGHFGFEEMFPNSVQLANDGFGNFWILDIDNKGNWNSVYYVCHDPPVMVKHSDNLTHFIEQIDEFGRLGSESTLDIIHEKVVTEIWNKRIGMMEMNSKDYNFTNIPNNFSISFLIADMTNEPIKTGFIWALSGPKTKIFRPTDKPIWLVEKILKQGFLSRLFSGIKN